MRTVTEAGAEASAPYDRLAKELDEDPDLRLERLIERAIPGARTAAAGPDPIFAAISPRPGAHEFTCSSCHLVVSRGRRAEGETTICHDCAEGGSS